MRRKNWLWAGLLAVPLAAAGIAYGQVALANDVRPQEPTGFICPLTGEELPCPRCCPLNGGESASVGEAQAQEPAAFTYPPTGEDPTCPGCCPVNER